MSALKISHQQSSAPSSSGGNTFGSFNFSPNKGIDEKKLLIGLAVAVVIYLVISRSKRRK